MTRSVLRDKEPPACRRRPADCIRTRDMTLWQPVTMPAAQGQSEVAGRPGGARIWSVAAPGLPSSSRGHGLDPGPGGASQSGAAQPGEREVRSVPAPVPGPGNAGPDRRRHQRTYSSTWSVRSCGAGPGQAATDSNQRAGQPPEPPAPIDSGRPRVVPTPRVLARRSASSGRGATESDALIGFAALGEGDVTTRGWPRAPR